MRTDSDPQSTRGWSRESVGGRTCPRKRQWGLGFVALLVIYFFFPFFLKESGLAPTRLVNATYRRASHSPSTGVRASPSA
jgi:hypothetical protein